MSYGVNLASGQRGPPIGVGTVATDDRVGVSLLRPERHWQRTTGSVSGVLKLEGEPLPYVHVWALPAGKDPLRDRVGVFTNNHGSFVISGLDPGEYAFWAQPVGSQAANEWIMKRGGRVDLDDSIFGTLVRVEAGRTTENIVFSMRQGRSLRPLPDQPPILKRTLASSAGVQGDVCRGVRLEVGRPHLAFGPLWVSPRTAAIGHDRWWATRVTVEWPLESAGVLLDWAGPYRNWFWVGTNNEGRFVSLPEWTDERYNRVCRSPPLDVVIEDYQIERAGSVARHVINVAWPASTDLALRFRSDDGTCDGEPMVVCDVSGCELRQ